MRGREDYRRFGQYAIRANRTSWPIPPIHSNKPPDRRKLYLQRFCPNHSHYPTLSPRERPFAAVSKHAAVVIQLSSTALGWMLACMSQRSQFIETTPLKTCQIQRALTFFPLHP